MDITYSYRNPAFNLKTDAFAPNTSLYQLIAVGLTFERDLSPHVMMKTVVRCEHGHFRQIGHRPKMRHERYQMRHRARRALCLISKLEGVDIG